jgi:site-specific DNA-methyltransferase (adenine-specific)
MGRVERLSDSVTLYLGDCREILPTLGKVDAVVTSPPYNQMTGLMRPPSGTWAQSDFGRSFVDKWQADGYQDDLPEQEYQDRQNNLFAALRGVCNPTASLFYNHQLRWRDGVLLHPAVWFQPEGWRLRAEIIWDRCGGMMFNARMFCRFDERILWFTASENWKWNQASVGEGTVWRIAREQNKEHPVAYPLELPLRCIRAATDTDDICLDPFMGSGTTGVACVKLGRKFIGIEIEPKYFDIACKRIEAELRQPRLFTEPPKPAKQEAML